MRRSGGSSSGSRRAVMIGFAVVALVAPQSASAGNGRKEGRSRAFSSCVRGISPYGAHVELNARMDVVWKSASRALVDFAFNESTVNDCGPSGRETPGGQLTFRTRLEFIGDQIESCSAGFPNGVSCTINPHKTQAVYDFSHGPVDNTDGRGSLKVGGAEVNSGKTGHIYSVKFITSSTLTHQANSATAQTTVDLHY